MAAGRSWQPFFGAIATMGGLQVALGAIGKARRLRLSASAALATETGGQAAAIRWARR